MAEASSAWATRCWRLPTAGPPPSGSDGWTTSVLFDLALDYAAPPAGDRRADQADDAASSTPPVFPGPGQAVSVVDDAPASS